MQTDVNGKLIFYIISTETKTFIFNKDNNCIYGDNLAAVNGQSLYESGHGSNSIILPLEGGTRYYIFIEGKLFEYDLRWDIPNNMPLEEVHQDLGYFR